MTQSGHSNRNPCYRDASNPIQASTPAITQATQFAHNGIEVVAPTVIGQPTDGSNQPQPRNDGKNQCSQTGITFLSSHQVLLVVLLRDCFPDHHLAQPLVLSSWPQLSSSRRPRTSNQLHARDRGHRQAECPWPCQDSRRTSCPILLAFR